VAEFESIFIIDLDLRQIRDLGKGFDQHSLYFAMRLGVMIKVFAYLYLWDFIYSAYHPNPRTSMA